MSPNNKFHQAQAQPTSGNFAGQRHVDSIELFEDLFLIGSQDADALIAYPELN